MQALWIGPGEAEDIDAVERLYGELCDHLQSGINYPGWLRGIYPTREVAQAALRERTLFVAKLDGELVGTVVLNHHPEPAYEEAEWAFVSDYSDVLVIHTLAVHPRAAGRKVGQALLDFAVDHATGLGMRAIRLDTYEGNLPAIRLYEKNRFRCVGEVDLGFGEYGLHNYKVFERLLDRDEGACTHA